jgi:hypothetical protein
MLPSVSLATTENKRGQKLSSLLLARTLRVATDNLDAVGVDLMGVVQLEVDVLDDESPYVVAEAVGVEMSLQSFRSAWQAPPFGRICATDLERQARLDLFREHVGNSLVKVEENLHGELGLYAALGNEVVQRVCEGAAQTVLC